MRAKNRTVAFFRFFRFVPKRIIYLSCIVVVSVFVAMPLMYSGHSDEELIRVSRAALRLFDMPADGEPTVDRREDDFKLYPPSGLDWKGEILFKAIHVATKYAFYYERDYLNKSPMVKFTDSAVLIENNLQGKASAVGIHSFKGPQIFTSGGADDLATAVASAREIASKKLGIDDLEIFNTSVTDNSTQIYTAFYKSWADGNFAHYLFFSTTFNNGQLMSVFVDDESEEVDQADMKIDREEAIRIASEYLSNNKSQPMDKDHINELNVEAILVYGIPSIFTTDSKFMCDVNYSLYSYYREVRNMRQVWGIRFYGHKKGSYKTNRSIMVDVANGDVMFDSNCVLRIFSFY